MTKDKYTLYTITDLLMNDIIKDNRSKLARLLKIDRGTVTKFSNDKEGTFHVIIYRNSKYRFFSFK